MLETTSLLLSEQKRRWSPGDKLACPIYFYSSDPETKRNKIFLYIKSILIHEANWTPISAVEPL